MIPKKPLFAHNPAQQAKQPQQRAHGFKPVVVQLKTVAPAQNVKLPPQSLRALQTPRPVGPMPRPTVNAPVIMRKAAPPVYKPQPAANVIQQKSAAVSPKPLLPRAMQLKAVTPHARPATLPMHAATTRLRVVQMAAAEVKVVGKKITAEGLKVDDYLFVDAAGGGESKAPAHTVVKMTLRVLRKSDVDYKLTAAHIDAVLNYPKPCRNTKSESPIHMNKQGRLPHYAHRPAERQPNLEYFVPNLGASRLVVDVKSGKVYLSHHYGDQAAKEEKIPEKFKGISAFVELDEASWKLNKILDDARKWWKAYLRLLRIH